jgi:malate synthase
VCREVFDARLGDAPHQLGRSREDVTVSARDLLDVTVPGGKITEEGVRGNLRVTLHYLDAWLRGTGAVAIRHLMEDAATAEISRCQLWQWLSIGARLDDGRPVTRDLVETLLAEERAAAEAEAEAGAGHRLADAAKILTATALGADLPAFFTTEAYATYLTATGTATRPEASDHLVPG